MACVSSTAPTVHVATTSGHQLISILYKYTILLAATTACSLLRFRPAASTTSNRILFLSCLSQPLFFFLLLLNERHYNRTPRLAIYYGSAETTASIVLLLRSTTTIFSFSCCFSLDRNPWLYVVGGKDHLTLFASLPQVFDFVSVVDENDLTNPE